MYSFRRFEARHDGLAIQVVAVWTAATDSRDTTFRQAHEGICRHGEWIRQCPTVIMGDFNANASYAGNHWKELMKLIEPLGLVSAYHRYFDEQFGAESRPTYFHRGNQSTGFHVDYCFLPHTWMPHVLDVKVGAHHEWKDVSDHVPLIVDVALPV